MGNIEKFNMMANLYDASERVEIARISAGAVRARLKNAAERNAIDFGCGTGLVGLELLDLFKSVVFVDASENMVSVVAEKIKRGGYLNATALCCDIEQSPSDLKTDCIFMAQVLLHIREVEPLLTRLHAMLHPGGRLLIVDFDKNEAIMSDEVHNGFVQSELSGTLKTIGFRKVESATFHHGKRIFMRQDASMFVMDAVK